MEVREELARVLASRQFRNTIRLQRFLQVSVERTLAGETDELKEYTIGRDAFDRGDDFDPRTDSIVRVEAQRLRGKLRDYYAAAGCADPVIITVNPGSYVPVFTWAIPVATPVAPETIAQPPDPNTVAVLPFANLSPEPEQDYFCDGITEDIINELTSIHDLNVVARTSSFVFKDSRLDLREIGARLSAGTVIEGSVRKSGEMLRVSAKIIDAASGRALWSESFDRQTGDVFAIEDEIAGAIASTLRVTLAAHRGERNGPHGFEAYSLYLKGRHAWNRMTAAGFEDAIELYSRAVSLYPDYALPHCGLADTFSWLAMWGIRSPREVFPKAKQAALESLRLDPLLAHAYTSLGVVQCHYDREWQDGTAMLRRAIELESSYSVGHHMLGLSLMFQGRLDDAVPVLRRALKLDPLSVRTNRTLGWAYYCLNEAEHAEKLMLQALAIDPDSPPTNFLMVEFYLHQGRDEEALAIAEPLLQAPPNSFGWGAAAAALARSGRVNEAQHVLDTMVGESASECVDLLPVAMAYAAAGNIDRAFEYLAQAIEDGSPFSCCLLVDPLFEDLRADPRFDQLAARVNLKGA